MPRRIVIVLALLMISAAGFAQNSGNLFVGYSYNRASTGWSDTGHLNGWEASAEGKIAPFAGLVADVGTQYGTLQIPNRAPLWDTGIFGQFWRACLQLSVRGAPVAFLGKVRAVCARPWSGPLTFMRTQLNSPTVNPALPTHSAADSITTLSREWHGGCKAMCCRPASTAERRLMKDSPPEWCCTSKLGWTERIR